MWKIAILDAEAVLHDELAKKSLARYFDVMQNKKPAKFLIAKRLPAEFNETASLATLWKEHEVLTADFHKIENKIDTGKEPVFSSSTKSYFDLKIEIAHRILQQCHFCSRRCDINRLLGELGYCKCGDTLVVSSIFARALIRVLILPNHLECCTRPTLNWIAENIGADTRVNLMFQYRPEWRAHEILELRRHITKTEIKKAIRIAKKAGLKNLV